MTASTLYKRGSEQKERIALERRRAQRAQLAGVDRKNVFSPELNVNSLKCIKRVCLSVTTSVSILENIEMMNT
jgi:hypothetical protein